LGRKSTNAVHCKYPNHSLQFRPSRVTDTQLGCESRGEPFHSLYDLSDAVTLSRNSVNERYRAVLALSRAIIIGKKEFANRNIIRNVRVDELRNPWWREENHIE
jgi:hypothetical protein